MKKLNFVLLIFILLMHCSQPAIEAPSKSASGSLGVVAAGDSTAVEAGLQMLQQGGNAADAAVATILALSIGDFKDFCIGSEAPFMIYDAKRQKVVVLSGQGGAPLSNDAMAYYYQKGIPETDIKAAAVPAIIDLCVTALQEFGTLSFTQTVQPALAMLQSREKQWHADLAVTFGKLIEAESDGGRNRQEKLQAVSDRFYRGDIADALSRWYQEADGFLSKADLAAHQTWIEEPVHVSYGEYEVYKCNTWTQGPVLLQTLKLLEHSDLKGMGHLSAEYIHTLTEALKLALADRDTWYGDPRFTDVPLEALLSDEYTALRQTLLDPDNASQECRPGDPVRMKALLAGGRYLPAGHGTTTCCVTDKWGNVAAATPSGWGSDAGSGGATGITHGTRLRSLNTFKGHPNCIESGKRPRITLTPTLVLKEGKPVLAVSVAGGDLQDQVTLQVLLNILEFGFSPLEAVSLPRFGTYLHENSFNPSADRASTIDLTRKLRLNESIGAAQIGKLRHRGHHVELSAQTIAEPVCIFIDQTSGIATGGAEPNLPHFTGALSDK